MGAGSGNLFWLGILLEVLSTMSGTIGKQLIRLSALRKRSNPKYANTCFYGGLIINTLCGPAIDMAAYSFAPQSLIAPFGGLDVVWNALSAPYLLQEKMTLRRAVGCLLICIGTAIAGAVGSHTDKVYTIDYLEDLMLAPRVPIYFAAFFLWFLLNICCWQKRPKGNAVRGISLGMTAGTIAGNMFCVKAAVEIIQYSIDENTGEPWKHWLTYAMLIGAAFFAISNVKYMTTGLLEFEALFMVTVYEGSMIVANCISGSIVLKDLDGLEAWRIALYWLSVFTIVVGMVVVFSNEMRNKSSLAAGTASIIHDNLLKDTDRHGTMMDSVIKTVGDDLFLAVGTAGMSQDNAGGVPKSPRQRKSTDSGSTLGSQSPSRKAVAASPSSKSEISGSPFFPDERSSEPGQDSPFVPRKLSLGDEREASGFKSNAEPSLASEESSGAPVLTIIAI